MYQQASSAPTFLYLDGSYVYVDTSAEVQPGQVGIFILNGESYIKEYQPDALYSHNQRYKPIPIHRDSEVRCCGRVTGIVGESDIANAALAEKIEAAFAEEDE